MAGTQEAPWSTLLALLSTKEKERSRKCTVRLLDTIFVPAAAASSSSSSGLQWFFTTKSGTLSKKKSNNSLSGVSDRFSRFALSNPNNVEKVIGVFVDPSGRRELLDEGALGELLSPSNTARLTQAGCYLQVYLRPYRGQNTLVSCRATRSQSGGKCNYAFFKQSGGGQVEALHAPSGLTDQMTQFVEEIQAYLLEAKTLEVQSMSADFVVDDNEHLWLSNVSHCSLKPVGDEINGADEGNAHPAATDRKPREKENQANINGGGNKLGSLLPSLSTERPSSSSSAVAAAGRSGATTSSTPRTASVLGSGEMLSRVGDAYCCAFGPDDLPGLRAWSLISLATNGANEHRWAIELDEYQPGLLLSPNPAVEAMRKQRAETRHRVPLLQPLVLRFADRILLGKEPLGSEMAFEAAWRKAFAQAKAACAGDPSAEAVVCGNTHAICRKLELLCKIEFVGSEKPPDLPLASMDRPQSESSAIGSARASTSGDMGADELQEYAHASARRAQSASERETGSSDVSGAVAGAGAGAGVGPGPAAGGAKGRGLIGGVRSLHLHQAFVEPSTQADSFFNSDMEVVPEPVAKQPIVHKKEQSQAAAASAAGNIAAGQGKKGKKKAGAPAANVGSGFRRDVSGGFDEPPSVDMIAKFAAEKEKHQRSLRQQQIDAQKQAMAAQLSQQDEYGEFGDGGNDFEDSEDYQDGWNAPLNQQRGPAPKRAGPGKKGKKKLVGAAGQLQKGGMLEEEERLARLERMAALPQQRMHLQQHQQQQQQMPQWPDPLAAYNPNGSFANSVVSNTETEFMARHMQQGDTAVFGGIDAMDSLLSAGSLVGQGTEKIDSALRERVKVLEKQLMQATAAAERKDGEMDKLAERLRKANSDLDHARKWSQAEIQRVKDENEMNVIRLREQHAKQMAAIAMAPEPKDLFGDSIGGSPSKQSADAFQANRQLLEQLEVLRSDQRAQLARFSEERRSMQNEASAKLLAQERQLKSEVANLRSQVTSLEDRVTQYSEETTSAKSKAETLAATCRQMEQARLDAVEQQTRLRADLKNMQQSVNATYRLESQQGMAVGVDADTQIRLNEAKSEARTRQLMNKVDFLKAQLAAEQANAEEMKEALSQNQRKTDEMRDDFRSKLKEMDQMKHYAVEEAEKRVESQYESRMAELTTLQSKMMMMQGQLQDAFQDGALLKQREEQAKGAAARANSQQSILRAEIEQLKVQLSELKMELEDSQSQGVGKHNNDAMLRRLDNERQYLKSQLASEITHKNEMQNALAQCNHQLNEVQKQWKQDVDTLREQLTNDKHEAVANEQRLVSSNISLEGDIARLETSNRDLKDAFVKCRDQVRMEQLAMENATSVNRRLLEQLESMKLDLQRIKQAEEQSADAHRQQISALKSAMSEAEARKTKETNKLKEELSTQYLLNSAAQMEAMQLRNTFQEERKSLQRHGGGARIVEMLSRWQKNRLSHALRVWSTNSTLIGVAKQFRGHVNDLMKETLAEERAQKEQALENLTKEMLSVQESRVAELRSELGNAAARERQEFEDAKRDEIDKIHVEMQQHIEEVEAHWMAEIEATKRDGENSVYRANQVNELAIAEVEARCQMTIDDNYDEYQRQKAQAIEQTKESEGAIWSQRMEQKMGEVEASHREQVVALMSDHTTASKKAQKEKLAELESLRQQMDETQRQALQAAEEAFQADLAHWREEARQKEAANFAAYQDQCNEKLSEDRQGLYEETEQRIRDLRSAWTEERDELLRTKADEYAAMLQDAKDEHAKYVEVERVRAVKLEASKWRQALKDAEHRFELEVNKAKAEGRADREKQAKEQVAAAETASAVALQAQANKHQQTITSIEVEHQAELERQQLRFDLLRMEAERKAEALTKEALDREFGDRLKKAVEEAWADSATMWQAKIKKEEDRLTQFKNDVAAQTAVLARERNDLQERVNQSDDMVRRLEAMNRSETEQLRKDFDLEREMTELKFKNAKKLALKDLAEEQTATLDAMESKYKDIAEARVKKERERVETDMKREVAQLQHESEQLITGLEEAVNNLKTEKTALSEQLERTAQKLEDTEDSLFDLQQEHKRAKLDMSVTLWRTTISVQKMRERFKEAMDQFDQEAQAREAQMQREFQRNLNEMTLSAMKLCSLLSDIEDIRKSTHQVLVGYKSEELMEKRTAIKVLERDLERLTMEKDSLEEQRDLAEEEIEMLEGQVRELEDQIREHNRTSSMQNGRINVAHARKKRRLDTELERVLESIEQKRVSMHDIDDKCSDKGKQRDDKETEMVHLEKELVSILVEQQRKVLSNIEVLRGSSEDKLKTICHVSRLPYPPLVQPSIEDVEKLLQTDAENRKKAAEEELEFQKLSSSGSQNKASMEAARQKALSGGAGAGGAGGGSVASTSGNSSGGGGGGAGAKTKGARK